MGHEYVEMKNSHAAIEAYRRAVGTVLLFHRQLLCLFIFLTSCDPDVNRKDYRAWYGLGQAYELLSMHHYALHYYQHATALRYFYFRNILRRLDFLSVRPYDVRLWQAQGMCYEEIGRCADTVFLLHVLVTVFD